MALSPWQPYAFLGSLFNNPHSGHIVFDIVIEKEWYNPSRTFFNGRSDSLEQVTWALEIQKQK